MFNRVDAYKSENYDIKFSSVLLQKGRQIKYVVEIIHQKLNTHKIISSTDRNILESKLKAYLNLVNLKYEQQLSKDETNRIKEDYRQKREELYQDKITFKNNQISRAEEQTFEAITLLKSIENVLIHTLSINDTVNWNDLKDKTEFILSPEIELEVKLSTLITPKEPKYEIGPKKPQIEDFESNKGILDALLPFFKNQKIAKSKKLFEETLNSWYETVKKIDSSNQNLKDNYENFLKDHNSLIEKIKQKNDLDVEEWNKQKVEFLKNQSETNSKIDQMQDSYMIGETNSVLEYCDMILNNSEYPDFFPKNFELDYNSDNKILVVEYSLPSIDVFPTLNEVKYVGDKFKEYHIADLIRAKLFDTTMYNITLRTIHELFEADIAKALEMITFNGWINSVNRAVGKKENTCILSIQVRKKEFVEIDLEHVDPKICFKNLKGVGSSKLSCITAVQPILQIDKTDKRFTNHYDVADKLDNTTNLASMDWEDFEHLIREIFAKEFSSNGGEVKVTQASKDGGVDAIAFDPDPIRGGKIIIQAKRYTNTVGVSAVRDLYGTVMSEGATKGILVTTADYGPDAYEFVKGKPLTLMNGANLLYLLQKHGHSAKIDIKEAKKLMKEYGN